MAMEDLIIDYVKDEYLEEGDETEIDENTLLISGGIVDSFSMVSLKMFLEKEYKISIPDERATTEAFDTVTSIMALVKEYAPDAE